MMAGFPLGVAFFGADLAAAAGFGHLRRPCAVSFNVSQQHNVQATTLPRQSLWEVCGIKVLGKGIGGARPWRHGFEYNPVAPRGLVGVWRWNGFFEGWMLCAEHA